MPGFDVPDEPWPLVLLGLRIAVVAALYVFLFVAFRALRAELRGSRRAEVGRTPEPAMDPAQVAAGSVAPQAPQVIDDPARPPPSRAGGVARPLIAFGTILVLVVSSAAAIAVAWPNADPAQPVVEQPPADRDPDPGGAPAERPEPGRVTVGLASTESSSVRVTVDGVVEFNGTLAPGDRQLWEGGQRIQIRTDRGQTMLISVNGQQLGAFSPAVGHPEWNLIDWGFWPGWEP